MATLTDNFGRKIDYLRLSVTDRCDLRCTYCRPEKFSDYEEPENWLDFNEVERLSSLFIRLGITRIRLTGGEPFLRRNILSLVQKLGSISGLRDLSLSTNGTQLEKYADKLRQAGVTRLNVSLDSLDRVRVRSITRRDVLPDILSGLEAVRGKGFHMIKINMVAMPDTHEEEIDTMVAYCMDRGFVLRLIETMPIGESGQRAGFQNLQPIKERLRSKFGLVDGIASGGGPARYLVSPDGHFKIGFITPISQHFCETCNRVRLAVDGILHLCLGQEDTVDLRTPMRNGCSDDDLKLIILAALHNKPGRHEFIERPQKILRVMSSTGG